ncbi:MAG: putative Ig domain-containing protein, partial [Caldilineaceae bacterium]|nr:putative Ig domain-containing protein [Caldilineaceae bacterium]
NGEYYQTAEGFDPDHQGRRRYPAERIADNIYGWLTNNPADVILLHIGTNQLSADPAQVERILNEIDRFDPNIIVVLAKITNWTPYNPTVTEFNTNVETMALARITNGDQIVMVDMENGAGFHYEIQPTGDMWDQVHPYATGYTKMAAVWLNALDDLLPICTAGVNILSQPPTTATVGQGYTYDVQASGFPLPTYTLLASPDGMTIDSATGIITWLPTAPGSFSVTVEAANNIGADSQSFTITTVEESNAPVLTSTPVTQGAVNQPYHYDVEATGAPAPTYALTAAPPGMTIDAATGLIAWTPTMIGNFAVTLEATNSNGSDSQSFTLTIVEVAACTTNQIAYWPLDEPSGSTLFTDLIGNHQGSCTGASCPTATGGQVAGAFAFDGGDGIAVPTAPALTWGSNDSFSLELLVNTTQSCVGNKVFLGKYKSSGNKASWWLGCEASGKALFSLRDSGGAGVELTSLAPINDGQWHHL